MTFSVHNDILSRSVISAAIYIALITNQTCAHHWFLFFHVTLLNCISLLMLLVYGNNNNNNINNYYYYSVFNLVMSTGKPSKLLSDCWNNTSLALLLLHSNFS